MAYFNWNDSKTWNILSFSLPTGGGDIPPPPLWCWEWGSGTPPPLGGNPDSHAGRGGGCMLECELIWTISSLFSRMKLFLHQFYTIFIWLKWYFFLDEFDIFFLSSRVAAPIVLLWMSHVQIVYKYRRVDGGRLDGWIDGWFNYYYYKKLLYSDSSKYI